jgi:hypothetical protein
MNKAHDRTQPQTAVPLTPNLEQYKLHGGNRNRTKKKSTFPNIQSAIPNIQCTIQPTHPPSALFEKTPTTPTSSALNSKHAVCQNHPDKKAMYFSRDNSKKQLCGICAVTDGGGDHKFFDDESMRLSHVEYEKTKSIEAFKKRVAVLK